MQSTNDSNFLEVSHASFYSELAISRSLTSQSLGHKSINWGQNTGTWSCMVVCGRITLVYAAIWEDCVHNMTLQMPIYHALQPLFARRRFPENLGNAASRALSSRWMRWMQIQYDLRRTQLYIFCESITFVSQSRTGVIGLSQAHWNKMTSGHRYRLWIAYEMKLLGQSSAKLRSPVESEDHFSVRLFWQRKRTA